MYADDFVLYGELEEELRKVVRRFVELCRRGMKVNAGMSSMMVINGKEGLEYKVHTNGLHLEHVPNI